MKIIHKIKYIGVAVLMIFVSACEDGFDDLNTDPNNPVAIPPSSLFNNGVFNMTFNYWDRAWNFEFGELMVQHMAQNEYTTDQNYLFSQSDFNFKWGNLYSGQNVTTPTGGLYDLAKARELVVASETLTDERRANQLAAIDIFMAFGFQMVTDFWGDVPYSQAFNAEYPFPVYDTQESIYADMISSVQSAVAAIDVSEGGFAEGDPLFDGDMAQWRAFGNALLIRLGMRLSESNPTAAEAAVSAGFGGALPTTDVMLVFGENQDVANPFYYDRVADNRDDFRISQELVDAMTVTAADDPRLVMYAEPAPGGTAIVGMPYGLADAGAFALKNTTSDIHENIEFNATAPAYLFSQAELEFFRAEAIARGWVAGTAQDAYEDAIQASMDQWGVAAADATAYIADPAVAYDATSLQTELESIANQKWIALYTNGVEAYAEWRRLDFPVLTVGSGATQSAIPLRMMYPVTEDGSNGDNLAAANNGSNLMSDPVSWDQ